MKRNLNTENDRGTKRAQAFAEIERQTGKPGTHPATSSLMRRPKPPRTSSGRLLNFLNIARGRRA